MELVLLWHLPGALQFLVALCFLRGGSRDAKEEVRGWFDPYLAVPELFLTKQHKPEWVNMEQLGNSFFGGSDSLQLTQSDLI